MSAEEDIDVEGERCAGAVAVGAMCTRTCNEDESEPQLAAVICRGL